MQNTYPQTVGHNLANGIAVRSKSEEIIVNLLEKHSIPYQYEPKLEINGVSFDGQSAEELIKRYLI